MSSSTASSETRATSQVFCDASRALAALSHPRRLDLVARVTNHGPMTVAELAGAVGTGVKDVSKDVVRLLESGVLRRDGSRITGNLGVLEELSAETVEYTSLNRMIPVDSPLRRFLVHGRIMALPKRPQDVEAIAEVLADLLPEEVALTEREVNARLAEAGPDVAALRRLLVDLGYVRRHGSAEYRRTPPPASAGTEPV